MAKYRYYIQYIGDSGICDICLSEYHDPQSTGAIGLVDGNNQALYLGHATCVIKKTEELNNEENK